MADVYSGRAQVVGSQAGPTHFLSTAWTMVARAQADDTGVSRHYLDLLIQRYWRPVYHFIRNRGRNHEDARDLTQGFFTSFVAKDAISYADQSRGKFRSFLMASVRRYLASEYRAAAVRPSERPVADFNSAFHEECFRAPATAPPDREFTRNWTKCLIENCLARLREECAALGKTSQYEAFRTKYLWEDGGPPPSHQQIAQYLSVSPKDVENLLYRAKKRLRRIVREEVRNAMQADGDPDEEIRELMRCLGE